jgi:hypothetical protein
MAAVMSTNEMPSAAPALPVDPKVKLSDASSADPAQDTADRHGGNSRGGLFEMGPTGSRPAEMRFPHCVACGAGCETEAGAAATS